MTDADVYLAIGEDGFTRLVRAFYAQVPGDDVLGPMYPPDDLHGAEERLRDFLIGRMRHAPFVIDQAARNRWVSLMDRALSEVRLPEDATSLLREFLHATATFMINR